MFLLNSIVVRENGQCNTDFFEIYYDLLCDLEHGQFPCELQDAFCNELQGFKCDQ